MEFYYLRGYINEVKKPYIYNYLDDYNSRLPFNLTSKTWSLYLPNIHANYKITLE